MSLSPQSLNSLDLVLPEIDTTIKQAEDSLSNFVENRDNGEALQNCIDCLNQLRGIYVLVEVQGCVLLCQQAVALANEVPVGAGDDKNELLSCLSNAIFVLRRYTEYFASEKKDYPELLLSVINELRQACSEKPYPESHFFDFDSGRSVDVASLIGAGEDEKLDNFEHHARRFRHMYQVGLLDLLKDRNTFIALKLITRAAQGSARLCAGEDLAQLWSLSSILAESMLTQKMELTQSRKRLFMKIERYLREMVMVGKVVAAKSAPESLTKDLVYLIALSGNKTDVVEEILRGFEVSELAFDDAQLRVEAKRLFGPGVDVLRSLSKAINEEMSFLKEKLDIFELGVEPNPEDITFVAEGLLRMYGTLQMLDMPKTAELSKKTHDAVDSWQASSRLVSESELLVVANGILTIESSIKHYEQTGNEADVDDLEANQGSHSSSYLSEARIVVVDEAKNGLALAKRSVSAYVESEGDKLHLANIGAVMQTIAGGMVMIDLPRVAAIVEALGQCIQVELLDSSEMPGPTLLETLADAMSSLEYFIESLQFKDSENDQLLKLSEESLESIGYEPEPTA